MNTSDCTYHCNRTRSPVSQSNKRKATPRGIKRPHASDLAKPLVTVPPPAIYVLLKNSPCSLNIQVKLTSLTSLASISTSALLDSRATSMFINWSFVQKHQLETTPLPQPVLMCNIDGSANENRSVTEEVHITLHFGHHSERAHLAAANLGQQTVIIGHSWLTLHNPEVDWATQKVSMTRCLAVMDESYQSLICCHRSLLPCRLPGKRRLFMRSCSPWSGRNVSAPPQPLCRDWWRRLRPSKPTHLEVPSQNITRLCRCLLRRSLHPPPPSQGMASCHRALSQCQAPQREDFPPLPHRTEGT